MDAFIGEIRPFAFGYVPDGWLMCDGSNYPIVNFQPLYSVIQNIYGGTPMQNFQVPNLTGQALVCFGQGTGLSAYAIGQKKGAINVALNDPNQLPAHSHGFNGATSPSNRVGTPTDASFYLCNFDYTDLAGKVTSSFGYVKTPPPPDTVLNAATVGVTGDGQAHENRQPTLAVVYGICYNGNYPVRP